MPAPPTGGPLSSCIPYVLLTWIVPVLSLIAGFPVSNAALVASLVASVQESAFWGCRRNKGLRRHAGALQWFPFPARLAVLCTIQVLFTDVLVQGGLIGSVDAKTAASLHQGVTHETPGTRRFEPSASNIQGETGDAVSATQERVASDASPKEQPLVPNGDAAALVEQPASAAGGSVGPVGVGLDGKPFYVDADPSTLTWKPKTLSVVLPCAEERDYALKTVKAIYDNTPKEVLHEIIVVDDGSEPPLSHTHLKPDVQKAYNTKVLRHEKTVGLIGAKKTGGDAATGDLSIFFDCHVAPQPGWHKAFFRLIGENYRRLVVPQITSLNIDSWTQIGSGGGMAKCYLTWDADFKWFESDDMYVAVISGGLLGMSRRWWFETGGYDAQMMGWGGENIDQSLRMWLCGGEIVAADDSFVAHMWRTGDSRTGARYHHVGDSSKNRARAVYAWYGEFTDKLTQYPQFSRRNDWNGAPWYGNLSNLLTVKDRLKCRPFSWFLRRFKSIYEDGGLIPPKVFMLKEGTTGKCLVYEGIAGTSGSGSGRAKLVSCESPDNHRLYWHIANKKGRSGRCCSGIRAWNTDQCLQDVGGGRFRTGICDVSGRNYQQQWSLNGKNELRQRDHCAGTNSGKLEQKPCIALRNLGWSWSMYNSHEPIETVLYKKARKEHPEIFTMLDNNLATLDNKGKNKMCGGAPEGCVALYRGGTTPKECLDGDMQFHTEDDENPCQTFYFKAGAIHSATESNLCVDRWSDNNADTWGLYGCHGGSTQKFRKEMAKSSFCNEEEECLVFRPAKP